MYFFDYRYLFKANYGLGDRNLKTINAVKTLKNALHNRKYPARELIHHSNRGLQYGNPS
jgi:hypothetical protein